MNSTCCIRNRLKLIIALLFVKGRGKAYFTRQFKDEISEVTIPAFNRRIITIRKQGKINCVIKFSYKKGNTDISVCKPEYDRIFSHTAIKSFCTNGFLYLFYMLHMKTVTIKMGNYISHNPKKWWYQMQF